MKQNIYEFMSSRSESSTTIDIYQSAVKGYNSLLNILKPILSNLYESLFLLSNMKEGISKLVFIKTFDLKGIIGERMYRMFSIGLQGIKKDSFLSKLLIFYSVSIKQKIKFVFELLDLEGNGKATREDVFIILSVISLNHFSILTWRIFCKKYANKESSIEKLIKEIIRISFLGSKEINLKDFEYLTFYLSSDLYLIIYTYIIKCFP